MQEYPECNLCSSTNCDEDGVKASLVLEDSEFTMNFVKNMLVQNVEEIASDCYFMAEVIGEKTSPMDIADLGYCIYVTLSQKIEMEADKRMEIAVVFREEFDKIVDKFSKDRVVAKGASSATSARASASTGWVDATPAVPAPVPAPVARPVPPAAASPSRAPERPATSALASTPAPVQAPAPETLSGPVVDDTLDFLKQLDEDIAEIESISGQVDELMARPLPPTSKPAGLVAVIQDLSPTPVATATPAKDKGFFDATAPDSTGAAGTKSDPIKLTKDLLHEMTSPKDLSRMDKGIKLVRATVAKATLDAPAPARRPSLATPRTPQGRGSPSGSLFEALQGSPRGKETGARPSPPARPASQKEVPGLDLAAHVDEPGAPAGPGGLSFVDPFAQSPATGSEPPSSDARVLLCHECKTLNKATHAYCKKCGFALK